MELGDLIEVECPHCGLNVQVSPDLRGSEYYHERCGKMLIVPELPESPSEEYLKSFGNIPGPRAKDPEAPVPTGFTVVPQPRAQEPVEDGEPAPASAAEQPATPEEVAEATHDKEEGEEKPRPLKARLEKKRENKHVRHEFTKLRLEGSGDVAAGSGTALSAMTSGEIGVRKESKKKEREERETITEWDEDEKPAAAAAAMPQAPSFWKYVIITVASLVIVGVLVKVGWREGTVDTANFRVDDYPADSDEVLEAYFAAASWRELLPYVRHPDAVGPIMSRWYAERPYSKPEKFEIESSQEGMMSVGRIDEPDQMWIVATQISVDDATPRMVPLERTLKGAKVDWESAVGYQPLEWMTFLETRPTEPAVYRVSLTVSDYNNFEFADAEKWQGYLLAEARNPEDIAYGYVERGGELHKKISSFFYPGETSIPMMLGLAFPEGGKGPNTLEITVVEQKNWVRKHAPVFTAPPSAD